MKVIPHLTHNGVAIVKTSGACGCRVVPRTGAADVRKSSGRLCQGELEVAKTVSSGVARADA